MITHAQRGAPLSDDARLPGFGFDARDRGCRRRPSTPTHSDFSVWEMFWPARSFTAAASWWRPALGPAARRIGIPRRLLCRRGRRDRHASSRRRPPRFLPARARRGGPRLLACSAGAGLRGAVSARRRSAPLRRVLRRAPNGPRSSTSTRHHRGHGGRGLRRLSRKDLDRPGPASSAGHLTDLRDLRPRRSPRSPCRWACGASSTSAACRWPAAT